MPDRAKDWGGAGRFMLAWALSFYQDGDDDAGDRHLAIAVRNFQEAWRAGQQELDARG